MGYPGTPSHHPFIDGLSISNHTFWGYPHDYGIPHMAAKGIALPAMACDEAKEKAIALQKEKEKSAEKKAAWDEFTSEWGRMWGASKQ